MTSRRDALRLEWMAAVTLVAMHAGCQTFAKPTAFRPFQDNEAIGVEFLNDGRVEEILLRDGRLVQALAVQLTNIGDQIGIWGDLDALPGPQILLGRHSVDDLARGGVKPFLLPYDPQVGLKRALNELKARLERGTERVIREDSLLAILGREQSSFLDQAPSLSAISVLVVCESLPCTDACLRPTRTYTLFLRVDRQDTAIHPFLVGKRSRVVSLIGGFAFLFGVYAVTIG